MGKNNGKEKKDTRRRLNSIILLLAFAAIMLIVSTYAWFSTQKSVKISNLAGTVQVAEGLEISLDGKTWKQEIDLSKVDWKITSAAQSEYPVYSGNDNNIPEELQPVSTTGATTATSQDLTFYKGTYVNTSANPYALTEIEACTPAVWDDTNGVTKIEPAIEDMDYPAYIAFDVFIKNTIQSGNATITEENDANALQLNLDSFAKILEKKTGDNNYIDEIDWANNVTAEQLATYEASGLQNTVRVGLAVYKDTAAQDANGTDALANTAKSGGIRQVTIWEPNSELHIQSIVDTLGTQVVWESDKVEDPGYNTWGRATQIPTWGVVSAGNASNIIPLIYKWASRADAYLAVQNSIKTTVNYTHTPDDPATTDVNEEAYTVADYAIKEGITNLYDVTQDPTDTTNRVPFSIKSKAISRVRVYLWLEGQDVDCLNAASMGHGVLVDLDLCTGEQTGPQQPNP